MKQDAVTGQPPAALKASAGRGPIVAKAMMDERPALPFCECAAANGQI
jgi:hypothetical protein